MVSGFKLQLVNQLTLDSFAYNRDTRLELKQALPARRLRWSEYLIDHQRAPLSNAFACCFCFVDDFRKFSIFLQTFFTIYRFGFEGLHPFWQGQLNRCTMNHCSQSYGFGSNFTKMSSKMFWFSARLFLMKSTHFRQHFDLHSSRMQVNTG